MQLPWIRLTGLVDGRVCVGKHAYLDIVQFMLVVAPSRVVQIIVLVDYANSLVSVVGCDDLTLAIYEMLGSTSKH